MPESSVVECGDNSSRSQLFMVRMWREDLGEGKAEWRGRVQYVLTGEIRYFHGWPMLIDRLSDMLPKERTNGQSPDSGRGNEAFQVEK